MTTAPGAKSWNAAMPRIAANPSLETLPLVACYGLIVALVAFSMGAYLIPSRMVPFLDDWTYVSALEMGRADFFKWLIAQHVDPRIPLQKAVQFFLLRVFRFDFRYLLVFNLLLCCLVTALYVETARLVRGRRSIGDCIFPFLILAPATGPSLWGFHLQFLSSVLVLSSACFACVVYIRTKRPLWLAVALTAIGLGALCGMNGLLTSTCLLIALAGIGWWMRASVGPVPRWAVWFAIAIAVLCLGVWFAWTPSSASEIAFDRRMFLGYAFGGYGSPFVVYSFINETLKATLVLVMALASLALGGCLFVRRRGDPAIVVVVATVAVSCIIGLSIAAGRATSQGGWDPLKGMHYSFLMIPILLGAWIALSLHLPSPARTLAGLFMAYLGYASYVANAEWRFLHVDDVGATRAALAKDLRTGVPTAEIAARYTTEMTWSSGDAQKAEVQQGLDVLRRHYALYGGPSP